MSPASGQMGEAEQQSYLSSGHARQRTLQKMPQSPSGGDPQSSSQSVEPGEPVSQQQRYASILSQNRARRMNKFSTAGGAMIMNQPSTNSNPATPLDGQMM